jgi:hypothetical protein
MQYWLATQHAKGSLSAVESMYATYLPLYKVYFTPQQQVGEAELMATCSKLQRLTPLLIASCA